MQVEEAEESSFLGPNGAGKSKTIKLGWLIPRAGRLASRGIRQTDIERHRDPRVKKKKKNLQSSRYFRVS